MSAFGYYLVFLFLPFSFFKIPTISLVPTEKLEMKHCSSLSLENGGEFCEKFNVTYLLVDTHPDTHFISFLL